MTNIGMKILLNNLLAPSSINFRRRRSILSRCLPVCAGLTSGLAGVISNWNTIPRVAQAYLENFEDTPPFIGHDAAFDSFDEAAQHFKSLVADAARTEADHLPQAVVLREEHSTSKKAR